METLISIKPRFVERILRGCKQAEFRTRPLRLAAGSRLWIYSTQPVAKVQAVAEIAEVLSGCPEELWLEVGRLGCITRDEYLNYIGNRKRAFSIIMKNVKAIDNGPSLASIRETCHFHPPQFLKRVASGSPLLKVLEASLVS